MGPQLVGKLLMLVGAILLAVGALTWVLGSGAPARGLPGDLHFQRGNLSVFIPLATCLLLSLALTAIANLVGRWLGR